MPSRAHYQKLAMLALAAQFRVREPFVQNQSGTFCLQRLLIIIHSLMDVFKRIATSLDPSSVNENTRKLQYNIFVYISSTVGHLWRFYAIVVERTNLQSPFITVLIIRFLNIWYSFCNFFDVKDRYTDPVWKWSRINMLVVVYRVSVYLRLFNI